MLIMFKNILILHLFAREIEFYQSGIDYYGISDVSTVKTLKNDFSWDKYLDSSSIEFMSGAEDVRAYVMNNPTKENIKKLKRWESLKREKYLSFVKNYYSFDATKDGSDSRLSNNLEYDLYYDSSCPYCKKMYDDLVRSRIDREKVKLIKVDNKKDNYQKFSKRKIREGESIVVGLNQNGKNVVPYLVVRDLENDKEHAYRGYVDINRFQKGE